MQPTTGVTPKLLRLFVHAQRPGARGFHMLKASETELRRSGPNVALLARSDGPAAYRENYASSYM